MERDQNRRGVKIGEAARYVGLTVAGFKAAVRRGVFPGPIPGTTVYDLKAINRRLDILSGIVSQSPAPELSSYDAWSAARESRSS